MYSQDTCCTSFLHILSVPSARGHCQGVAIPLFGLTASTQPFGCFTVRVRMGAVCLGRAVPLLGAAQPPATVILKQYVYTHHREKHQQRGKIHTTGKYSEFSPTFVWLKNRVTLHTTVLGLFSIRVMLLLCCFNPIKKGPETLISWFCYFTMNNGLVRESRYRKQQFSLNGGRSPGC